MWSEYLDFIISAVIFSGMGQGKDSGKLLFRKIFSDGTINISEDETSLTFSSTGGNGGAVKQDRVAIGTGTGITHSFICTNYSFYSLTNVRSVRGSYDLSKASYNTGQHSFIIGGSTNSIFGGYYSTIVGGQTNSIYSGGTDLIVGGSLNKVTGFKQQSLNRIFGGYANEIMSLDNGSVVICNEIFGGRSNKILPAPKFSAQNTGNKIIGGQENQVTYFTDRSVILGGVGNYVSTKDPGPGTNCSKSNLILSSYLSISEVNGSNYPLALPPVFELLSCETKYNNIIGSRQSVISSKYSTYYCAPRYSNIIGGCKNKMGGWYSNIISGFENHVIGNLNSSADTNFSYMQIISSNNSKICGNYYANIISSYNSYLQDLPDKIYSRNLVSTVFSKGLRGGNQFSTSFTDSKGFGLALATVGGKFDGNRIISSNFPSSSTLCTSTASTSMIVSSQLDFFNESFGVSGHFTQKFHPGATNNIYPHRNSLILSSSLVMNYNSFNSFLIFGGDPSKTIIISSNKILSGYNSKGYSPEFTPEALPFNEGTDDSRKLADNTLMISNYYSCQRSNINSLMISNMCGRMSNGLYNSIIGGDTNMIRSFGPAFYDISNINPAGDNDGRILRAINGGEVEGKDLGLSRHNMILGGSCNCFISVCGSFLQIGTAGPGLLNGNLSMNTRFSSIIGGQYNAIIADIGTATPAGKSKGVVCNPILNSVILGSCCKEMRISNHTGVDNLIITGSAWGGSYQAGTIDINKNGITGTFNSPITSIEVCRGFVVGVTSDKRLKIIIKKIGISKSNLNIYLFKYISNPFETYEGVIAQELLRTEYHQAVSINENGFYQVDYSKIDVEFKKVYTDKNDFQYSSI